MPADVVWQTMRDAAGGQLNREMVEVFLAVLPPYPLGTMVEVTNTVGGPESPAGVKQLGYAGMRRLG